MSNSPEADFDLELHFLPAWAKQPPETNRYADFKGESEGTRDRKRSDRRDRPPRRDVPGGTARGPRPPGPRGDRPPRDADRFREGDRLGPRRGEGAGRPPKAPEIPLPELDVEFVPDNQGVDSLARQIRMTGRAYPLFDIAQMILQKPERHSVTFRIRKKADGTPAQALFVCAIDDSLWLSEDEAVRYVLDKHFSLFYQPERTRIDPPKGTYTFVAQCGISGVILGPPNYHDYQNQLRRLHATRFSRMPFETFKSRVKIVRDEAVVKQWIEEQSYRTEYVCLNMPEPLKLPNRDEVTKHFREHHLANIIKPVDAHNVSGTASRELKNPQLRQLVRQRWEEQRRFPLQIATLLSQQFAARGLQFFKVNKSVTHVSVARPHYLDLDTTPVSESVRRIVEFINAHPKSTHKQLIAALAPRPAAPPAPARPASDPTAPDSAPAAAPAAAPAPVELTPEEAAIQTDLHWLIHQGHVIEFANGVLETAKKPAPKPPPAPPKKGPPAAEATATAEPGAAPTAEATAATDTPATTTESSSPAAESPTVPEAATVAPAGAAFTTSPSAQTP